MSLQQIGLAGKLAQIVNECDICGKRVWLNEAKTSGYDAEGWPIDYLCAECAGVEE